MSYNSTFKPRKNSMRQAYAEKVKRNGMSRSKTPHKALKFVPGAQSKPKGTLPRKAMRRVSRRLEREQDAYYGQRRVFLQRYPICGACLTRGLSPAASAQVHHARGRIGKLLRDERFWIAVCAECHEWIHEHPREARELGLLASATEFNTLPR